MLWTDTVLDPFAQMGDPAADAIIARIFATGDIAEANSLFRTIQENQDGIPNKGMGFLQDWFRETAPLPPWFDPERVRDGQQLFLRHAPAISAALYNRALPELYCGWKGVQVLAISSRLNRDPARRINETGQFVFDVADIGGFLPGGRGVRSAQKVRLVHAGVRHLIKSRRGLWNPLWDEPISQEHLAGTNLAFSSSTLEGLMCLGINFTPREIAGYMHLWKVAGWYMGIEAPLLTDDYAEARALAAAIRRRNFARSDEGVELTRSLINHMKDMVPGETLDRTVPMIMRWMLGEEMADMLEVPVSRFDGAVTRPIRLLNRIIDRVGDRSPLIAAIFTRFNRQLLKALLANYRQVNKVEFQISPTLRTALDLDRA